MIQIRMIVGTILILSTIALAQATRPTKPAERVLTVKLKTAAKNATNPTLTDVTIVFTNTAAKGIEAASGAVLIYDQTGGFVDSIDWVEDETLKPGESHESHSRAELKPKTAELLTTKPETLILIYTAGTVSYSDGSSDSFGK